MGASGWPSEFFCSGLLLINGNYNLKLNALLQKGSASQRGGKALITQNPSTDLQHIFFRKSGEMEKFHKSEFRNVWFQNSGFLFVSGVLMLFFQHPLLIYTSHILCFVIVSANLN